MLLTALVLDSRAIRKLTDGVEPNSDDHPSLEYPARGHKVAGEEFWGETLELILKHQMPPGDAQRLVLQAQLSLLRANPDAALARLAEAKATSTDHPGPAGLRQGIEINQAQARWHEAMSFLSRGDVKSGRLLLEQAVSLAPLASAPAYELGRILFESGQVKAAVPLLEVAVNRSKAPRHARLLLGDAFLLSGRAGDAEKQYLTYLATEPPRFEVLAALGDSLLQQGRRQEALMYLRQADTVQPGNKTLKEMLSRAGGEPTAGR
jgi:tetratricopeptide (TPR) repeat protein